MVETDEEEEESPSSLPQRAAQRIVRDLQHDIQGAKRKGSDIFPSALTLFVEKWLGFWISLIGLTITVGFLGIGLIYAAEIGSTIPALSSTIPWFLGHIWTVGLLVTLTYGVILLSLLLVSAARLVLWCRDTYLKYWNRDTPPFTADTSEKKSARWPPTNQQRQKARNLARDYIGNGAVLFVSILFVLVLLEQIATETLNRLLSSRLLTVIGDSIDVGIGVLDFESVLRAAAPNASQPQLILFILFFVLPAGLMAIGTRNLLYLIEGRVRTHIENVREGNFLSWSALILVSMFLYSLGICANILIQWG
jgi:hypothetical protein